MTACYVLVLLCGCVTLNACVRKGQDDAPSLNATLESSARPASGAKWGVVTRISGEIVDESERPVEKAIVRIQSLSNTRETSTDSNGRYEITGIRPNVYSAMARKPGYVTRLFGQLRPFEPGASLDLRNGADNQHVDFAMDHGGEIVGTVTDESGQPLPGAVVSAIRARSAAGYRSDWRMATKSLETRAPDYDVGHTPMD